MFASREAYTKRRLCWPATVRLRSQRYLASLCHEVLRSTEVPFLSFFWLHSEIESTGERLTLLLHKDNIDFLFAGFGAIKVARTLAMAVMAHARGVCEAGCPCLALRRRT